MILSALAGHDRPVEDDAQVDARAAQLGAPEHEQVRRRPIVLVEDDAVGQVRDGGGAVQQSVAVDAEDLPLAQLVQVGEPLQPQQLH